MSQIFILWIFLTGLYDQDVLGLPMYDVVAEFPPRHWVVIVESRSLMEWVRQVGEVEEFEAVVVRWDGAVTLDSGAGDG